MSEHLLNDEGKVEYQYCFACETCGRKEAEPSIAANKVVKDSDQSENEEKLPDYVYLLCTKCG